MRSEQISQNDDFYKKKYVCHICCSLQELSSRSAKIRFYAKLPFRVIDFHIYICIYIYTYTYLHTHACAPDVRRFVKTYRGQLPAKSSNVGRGALQHTHMHIIFRAPFPIGVRIAAHLLSLTASLGRTIGAHSRRRLFE